MADETLDNSLEDGNMLENLLSPFCTVAETPLPKSTPEIPGGIYLSGFISQDCTWGCCFNRSVVKCFPVEKFFEDNQNVNHASNASVVVSSSSYTFIGGHISCATELAIHNHRVTSGTRKLLLGISYSGSENNNRDLRGALVIFDPIRSAPMKWIEIPEPVSSVTVLSHFEEGGSNRPFFNETMMAMVGIAAVGLRGGSVVVVDLGLDDPYLSSGQTINLNMENFTYRLLNVHPHEYVIATKRHKAVSKRCLISLRFTNEPEHETVSDTFHYCRPNGESIIMLHKTRVAVTCIEYVPAIGCLLVGFTCGGFQIWRVNNMELQYSSDPVILGRDVHVFGFSFQQPVDDPKNYCYVWVMYGNKSAEYTSAHIELYSLLFDKKEFIDNFGYAYDDLRQCARRLSFPLQDDFLSTEGDCESGEGSVRSSSRPIRIWTQPDTDVMFCAWEVSRGGLFYIGAFDLNQWYSNHTRESFVFHPVSGLSPYWVTIPVETPDDSSLLLDTRIIPKSLMRWENPHLKLDAHLYPASYSFRAVCLTNTGVSAFEHYGVQEKLIRVVMKDGVKQMIKPEKLKNTFMSYGLEPVYPHVYGEDLSQEDRDRFFIFSVLLESKRTAAIVRLASLWHHGAYANVGCTLDLIIDWIGSYMVAVRSLADEPWQNLFLCEDQTLPPETIRFINFSNFAWTSLHRMLRILMQPTETEMYSSRGEELEDIEFGLGKLVQYSTVLLMMYKAKLLPDGNGSFFRGLKEYYDESRMKTRNKMNQSSYIDQQYKESHPLMIDYLMDHLCAYENVREEWNVPEGQALYPPQHVGYLVNMFMWHDADPRAISRVFMYFLLDLNSCFAQYENSSNGELERKVRGDFKAVMGPVADEYQEILALWFLDHGVHEDILVLLKEKDRLVEMDGLPWCAATVALTAAGFETDVADLLLKSCPSNLARLRFSLMTSSMSRYNSLADLMVSSNLSSDASLLTEFFEISEARNRLEGFIKEKARDLPEAIKKSLILYLNQSNSLLRLSLLLMLYVYSQDFDKLEVELPRVQNILSHQNLSERERKDWEFQQNFILHLLNTRSSGVVTKFLRMQGHQSVHYKRPVLTIKAVEEREVTPPREAERFEGMVPPQLRRLKLSESMAQDPLSPLRRYAARVQTAVATPAPEKYSDKDELKSRRLSRRSIAQRVSFSKQSMGNRTVLNDSMSICEDGNQEGFNATLRNTTFSLISLLQVPPVDHRVSSRFANSLNQTVQGLEDEEASSTQNQNPPVQSIMKEKDPSKPKVAKKVELNLEGFSRNESEDENESNRTIYEDASEHVEGVEEEGDGPDNDVSFESVQSVESAASVPETVVDANASFSSALERSVYGERESVPVAGTGDVGPSPSSSSSEDEEEGMVIDESRIVWDETAVRTNTEEDSESYQIPVAVQEEEIEMEQESEVVETTGGSEEVVNQTVYGLEIIEEEEDEKDSSNASVEESADQSLFQATMHFKDTEKDVFIPPEPPSKSTTPSPTPSPSKQRITPESVKIQVSRSPSKTPTKEVQESSPSKTPKKEEEDEPVGLRTRSSLSRTPTREGTDGNQQDVNVTPPLSQRLRRSSRSRTPTREFSEEGKTELEMNLRRSMRSSRSRTPSRDTLPEDSVQKSTSPDGSESERRLRRKSRSVTPSREMDTLGQPEIKKVRRVSGRSSRASTPTRDLTLEEIPEETEGIMTRRRSRVSRSRTPTRDTTAPEVEITTAPIRRTTRGSSRSNTPTRELQMEENKEEVSGRTRRSSRSTRSQTRELDEDAREQIVHEILNRKPKMKVEVEEKETEQEEVTDDPEKIATRRTLRATRSSVTPSRETEGEEGSLERSKRRSRVSRSKTPTREVDLADQTIQAEEPEKRATRRRGTRAVSKTPTKEVKEEPEQSEVSEEPEEEPDDTLTSSMKLEQTSTGSFSFEKTTNEPADAEGEEEEETDTFQEEVKPGPSKRNTRARSAGIFSSRGRKRALKYFQHEPELSTLIEDSTTDLLTDPSILEATVLPVKEPPKQRKIKGIRARTPKQEEEGGSDLPQAKPSKRRKAAINLDFDDDEEDNEDLEVQSQVSTRSNRSTSSKKSTASSTKGKRGRRGRTASKN